jgi:NAD-dependent dihydropyrimidine dehydrogenase PreA subunit
MGPVVTLTPSTAEIAAGASMTWTAAVSDGSDEEARVLLLATTGQPRVQFAYPGVANSPLSVSVTGVDIVVSLATDTGAALSSTASQVAQAINASPAASALVLAETWPGRAGTGIVQPRALASLSRMVIAVGSTPIVTTCLTSVPGWCTASHASPTPGTQPVVAFLDLNGNGIRDAAEPSASGQATWVDRTAPALTLPDNIAASASSTAGASVSFTISRMSDETFNAMPLLVKLKLWAHGRKTAYTPRADACHACGLCVAACPERAIRLVRLGA